MNNLALRRSFVLFHCTLAGVIFTESMNVLLHGLGSGQKHVAFLAGAEALACVLFVMVHGAAFTWDLFRARM